MKKIKSLNFLDYISYIILIFFSFNLSLYFLYSLINLEKLKVLDFSIIFLTIFLYVISKYKEDKFVNFLNIFKFNNIEALFLEIIRLGSSYGFSLSFFYLISIVLPVSIRDIIKSSFIMNAIGDLLQEKYIDLVLEYFIVIFLVIILLIIFTFLYFIIASLLYLISTPFIKNLKSTPFLFFQRAKNVVNYIFFRSNNKQEKTKLDLFDYFIILLTFILSFIIIFYIFFQIDEILYKKFSLDPKKSLLDNMKYLAEKAKIKNLLYFFSPLPIYVFLKILFDKNIRKKFGLISSEINLKDKNQEI